MRGLVFNCLNVLGVSMFGNLSGNRFGVFEEGDSHSSGYRGGCVGRGEVFCTVSWYLACLVDCDSGTGIGGVYE